MSDTRTAASLKARTDEMVLTVRTLVETMKLRQWAVEQAREALKSTAFPNEGVAINAHMRLTERIHEFVLQPALDSVKAIEAVGDAAT